MRPTTEQRVVERDQRADLPGIHPAEKRAVGFGLVDAVQPLEPAFRRQSPDQPTRQRHQHQAAEAAAAVLDHERRQHQQADEAAARVGGNHRHQAQSHRRQQADPHEADFGIAGQVIQERRQHQQRRRQRVVVADALHPLDMVAAGGQQEDQPLLHADHAEARAGRQHQQVQPVPAAHDAGDGGRERNLLEQLLIQAIAVVGRHDARRPGAGCNQGEQHQQHQQRVEIPVFLIPVEHDDQDRHDRDDAVYLDAGHEAVQQLVRRQQRRPHPNQHAHARRHEDGRQQGREYQPECGVAH